MLYFLFVLFLQLAVLCVVFYVTVYMVSLVYSTLMGSPFVRTKDKVLKEILKSAHIKRGQLFVDVGCGDGYVVRTAAKLYGIKGIGIDINPLLIWRARLITKLQRVKNVTFKMENILLTDLSKADVIYMFLLPKLISTMRHKLRYQTKKNVLIISHGFRIDDWDKYLIKTIPNKPFSTFFYKIVV